MSDSILFTYTPPEPPKLTKTQAANIKIEPTVASFPGVPTRDLVESDLESLPWWIVNSLDASDLYQATKAGQAWIKDHAPSAPEPEPAPVVETGEEIV